MDKDIAYLRRNFETEMEMFSFPASKGPVPLAPKLSAAGTAAVAAVGGIAGIAVGGFKKVLENIKKPTAFDEVLGSNDEFEDIKDEREYFYQKIIQYCDEKGIDEVDMYKKAGLNRSIFSKIRSMGKTGYTPSKSTVICICLALKLSLEESVELLQIVGYTLSDKMIVDKIIGWCIVHNQFDVFKIDDLIYEKTGEAFFA